MRTTLLLSALALSGVAVLAACAGLSPEQQQSAIQGIEGMVSQGVLSRAQADAMIQSITGGGWSQTWDLLLTGGLSVLSSLTGVRIWRGGINSRNGEVPAPTVVVTAPVAAPVAATP